MSEEAKGRASRRLAAILVASLAPLSPGDERGSLARLRSCLAEIIVPLISQFDGSIFKQTGDVVLSEFGSVVEAARCAAALREAMVRHNQSLPSEQRIAMRIGINLGDVIADRGDIFGDGVNIAARLAALAEPDSILASGTVHHHVADKVDFEFEDRGRKQLKNISRPVRIYRMGGKAIPEGEDFSAYQAAAVSLSGFESPRDRGTAVRQFQRRPGAGILRRGHHRGYHFIARRVAGLPGDRARLYLHLQGQDRRRQRSRGGIGRALRSRR